MVCFNSNSNNCYHVPKKLSTLKFRDPILTFWRLRSKNIWQVFLYFFSNSTTTLETTLTTTFYKQHPMIFWVYASDNSNTV